MRGWIYKYMALDPSGASLLVNFGIFWEVLNGVGVDGVGVIFPFFYAFFVFLRIFSFFFVFLRFSPLLLRTGANC